VARRKDAEVAEKQTAARAALRSTIWVASGRSPGSRGGPGPGRIAFPRL